MHGWTIWYTGYTRIVGPYRVTPAPKPRRQRQALVVRKRSGEERAASSRTWGSRLLAARAGLADLGALARAGAVASALWGDGEGVSVDLQVSVVQLGRGRTESCGGEGRREGLLTELALLTQLLQLHWPLGQAQPVPWGPQELLDDGVSARLVFGSCRKGWERGGGWGRSVPAGVLAGASHCG